MGQIIRLTTRTVQATELVHDHFAAAIADGIVTVEEQHELRLHIGTAYQQAQATDVAFGIGVSILRGGVDSGWAERQGFDASQPLCISDAA